MEVREFLEGDMKAFLDARLSVDFLREQTQAPRFEDATTMFGKDYEKLLLAALNEHDIPKAKNVLHEVKDQFSSYPVGSAERQHLQALLHALYVKFKLYLEDETTISKLETALDTIDSSPKTSAAVLDSDTHGLKFGRAEGADKEIEEALAAMDAVAKNPPPKQPEVSQTAPQPDPQPIQSPAPKPHPHAEYMPPQPVIEPTPEPAPQPEDPAMVEAEQELKKELQDQTESKIQPETTLELPEFETLTPQLPVPSKEAEDLPKTTPQTPEPTAPGDAAPEQTEMTPQNLELPAELPTSETELTPQNFSNIMQQLDNALEQGAVRKAYWVYKEAKNQYLLLTKEQQTTYHQTLLDYHKKILSLVNKNTSASNVLRPIEQDLVAAMKTGDLHEAMIHYEELRNEAIRLPKAAQEEYVNRMQEYYRWILSSWNEWQAHHQQKSFLEQHERRLSGKP